MADGESPVVVEQQDDVTIVRFTRDQIREDSYTKRASDEMKKIALEIGGTVLVSLGNVRFMSSSGIAALVLLNRLLHSVRGRLMLCDVQPLILQLFVSGGFQESFDIRGSLEKVLADLGVQPGNSAADPEEA